MIKKGMIKDVVELLKYNLVYEITKEESASGILLSVGLSFVRIFKKPGRTLMTCDCEHGTRFCNSPVICKHKMAAIKYLMDKK